MKTSIRIAATETASYNSSSWFPPPPPPQLFTERQLCEWLNVSKRNLFCWRMAGLIPYIKIGRAVRYRTSDVERALSTLSAMTFERAEQIHGEFLARMGEPPDEAKSRMLEFLGWDDADEESFAPDVRILLVSEDFGKELTTAVLWLRDRDIDIRCIRLRPYQDGESRLIDVQQIIPLPEAHEYQIQLREKEQVGRKKRAERYDVRLKFWEGLVALARSRQTRHANIKPGSYHWLGASSGIRGLGFNYVIVQEYGITELYIDRGEVSENKRIFDQLHGRREEIETNFGGALSWERLETKRACRIKHVIERGGYRSPESEWPAIQSEMVETMVKLENSLKPALDALGL